jgi:hypothetical protein
LIFIDNPSAFKDRLKEKGFTDEAVDTIIALASPNTKVTFPEKVGEKVEMFLRLVPRWEVYVEVFGIDAVRNVLSDMYVTDVAQKKVIEIGCHVPSNAILLRERVKGNFESYRGEWKKEYSAIGNEYYVAHNYSSILAGKILPGLLTGKFPFLSGFKWKAYGSNGPRDEIYVSTGITEPLSQSLYVPFEALEKRSWEIIRNRNTTYFTGYRLSHGDGNLIAESLLTAPESLRFKEALESGT